MKKDDLTFTVAIPTYYGGFGLVKTAQSIISSKGVGKFRLIVSVDGNPLQQEVKAQLKKLGVEVIENKQRGGQVTRIKQNISLTNSEIIILTQDDVLFDKHAIANILNAFKKNPNVTMIGAKLLPTPAKTFFEKIVGIGINVNYFLGKNWNNGDNYLLASGRCLAFRTFQAKKLNIPDEVINSDAFLYFENKRRKGKFLLADDAIVYNKSPQNLKEHLKQSKKFQYSQEELSKYLDVSLVKEYSSPRVLMAKAFINEFLRNPVYTGLYILISIYTRIMGKNMYSGATRFWSTDISTKRIK